MRAVPSENELVDAIADATRDAVKALLREHPGERFYYFSLITTGQGHPPELCAWSSEALKDAASDEPDAELELKWSYADSPFYGFGDEHFNRVRKLFDARPWPDWADDEQYCAEVELRLRAMEKAMARLDLEGLFGTGDDRNGVVINAEVMPPDHTNVERAKRLNPPEALVEWLDEAAEPEDV